MQGNCIIKWLVEIVGIRRDEAISHDWAGLVLNLSVYFRGRQSAASETHMTLFYIDVAPKSSKLVSPGTAVAEVKQVEKNFRLLIPSMLCEKNRGPRK